MAEFRPAVDRLLRLEGGFVDHPADSGGATKFGISSRSYPTIDVAGLTREDAEEIYLRDWWGPLGLDAFPQAVADKVFDLAVVMGRHMAILVLQRALRAAGYLVKEDGLMGPETRGAAIAAPLGILLAALRSEAAGHFRVVAERRADKGAPFLRGWLRRAYEDAA